MNGRKGGSYRQPHRSTISELLVISSSENLTYEFLISQLKFAAAHILPVANAIAALMGAAVSIFIVGPIPESNGVIESRSINVNHPGGTTDKTWPEFDPIGFQQTEDSIVRYGIANFSESLSLSKFRGILTNGNSIRGV